MTTPVESSQSYRAFSPKCANGVVWRSCKSSGQSKGPYGMSSYNSLASKPRLLIRLNIAPRSLGNIGHLHLIDKDIGRRKLQALIRAAKVSPDPRDLHTDISTWISPGTFPKSVKKTLVFTPLLTWMSYSTLILTGRLTSTILNPPPGPPHRASTSSSRRSLRLLTALKPIGFSG